MPAPPCPIPPRAIQPPAGLAGALARKLMSPAEVVLWRTTLARPLVFTNGVFDVLHRGHVNYLAQARELAGAGGSLLVALNTDASARRLGKGPDRPLNSELDRAIVIAALHSVDAVTWFDEDTPLQLIEAVRPEVLVKGGDYDMSKLPETRVVEAHGGRALAIPFVDGYSTTRLVSRIRSGA